MNTMISTALAVAMVAVGVTASSAAVTIYSEEVGTSVVFTFSGSLDLAGIGAPSGSSFIDEGILVPSSNYILFGNGSDMNFRYSVFTATSGSIYSGLTVGTISGGVTTGDEFYISGSAPFGTIGLAVDYVGGAISGSSTFALSTLASLGLIEDSSLVHTLPSADTITWNIFADPTPPATVPIPATLPLLFVALSGLGFAVRRRKVA